MRSVLTASLALSLLVIASPPASAEPGLVKQAGQAIHGKIVGFVRQRQAVHAFNKKLEANPDLKATYRDGGGIGFWHTMRAFNLAAAAIAVPGALRGDATYATFAAANIGATILDHKMLKAQKRENADRLVTLHRDRFTAAERSSWANAGILSEPLGK